MYELQPDYPYTMPTASHFRDPRPWDNGGMKYGRNTALFVTFATDADLAARLLPKPFRLGDEALISVSAVMCRNVEWLAGMGYNLVGVDVAAVFDGQVDRNVSGTFCAIMWENMTEPILGGRDHSGVPKVYADITDLERTGDTCGASVSHFGHPILDMQVKGLKALPAERRTGMEQARRDGNWMNYKYFPNAQNDGADVSYACTYPTSGKCPEAWEGQGSVRFHPSSFEKNPTQHVLINMLAEMPVHDVRAAGLAVWEPFMALDREPRILK